MREATVAVLVSQFSSGKSSRAVGRLRRSLLFGAHGLIEKPAGPPGLESSLSPFMIRIDRHDDRFIVERLDPRGEVIVDGQRLRSGSALVGSGSILLAGSSVLVLREVSVDQLSAIEQESTSPLTPVPTLSPRLASLNRRLRAMHAEDVLLLGETGTGKEVYARAMHALSGRRGAFVAVNCACLPRELAESELFGFARGSHSQAGSSKAGLIREAEGGTVLLDELGEMPLELQAKLLRFLQFREYTPLGASRAQSIDVRVLAATNRSVSGGQIRQDLRYRFGDAIVIPSLRERKEDIPALIEHVLRAEEVRHVSSAAFRALLLYEWPGNVRELEKVLTRAVAFARGSPGKAEIDLAHLPGRIAGDRGYDDDSQVCNPMPLRRGRAEVFSSAGTISPIASIPTRRRPPRPRISREALDDLLRRHEGRIADVARQADRRWQVIWSWIREYGLDVTKYRPKGDG